MSYRQKGCAPGVQSDNCRICNRPIMEGNTAKWAHDACIEHEKASAGDIHLPSPDEILVMCAEMRAERGHNVDEITDEELLTGGMRREDYCPTVHKLHVPNRRGRTIV